MNDLGQLGDDGTEPVSRVPVRVNGIRAINSHAGGGGAGQEPTTSMCASLATGSVDCWGSNNVGRLAGGKAGDHSNGPVTVRASGSYRYLQ